jgi:hypothetical protein
VVGYHLSHTKALSLQLCTGVAQRARRRGSGWPAPSDRVVLKE